MKTEQLEQLIKIVELGSMNEAAKELFISRSSLSSSMKKLEEELGADIFVRHSKGIRLTPFGATVLKHAHDICDRVDFLMGLSQVKTVQSLTISSMFCSMANDAFADLIGAFPDESLHASIEECNLEQVLHRVSAGTSRIGIVTEYSENKDIVRHLLDEHALEYHVLCERKLGAIVGRKNPLFADERGEVELSELLRYPLLENYATPTDHAWEYTLGSRSDTKKRIYVSDLGLALRLVSDTDAVMIDTNDESVYRNLYARTDYHFIPIKNHPECKTGWIKLKDTRLTRVETAFIKLLEEKALFT